MKQLALVVDPIACDGHGLCAELLPERIELDEWGYPILGPDPIGPALERHARRAVDTCPKLALTLRELRTPRVDGTRSPSRTDFRAPTAGERRS